MKTQNERLLGNLLQGFRINGLNAWSSLGIYRLASRIHDLRTGIYDGKRYRIKGEWKKAKNQFGEPVRFMEYFIDGDDITEIMIERKRREERDRNK